MLEFHEARLLKSLARDVVGVFLLAPACNRSRLLQRVDEAEASRQDGSHYVTYSDCCLRSIPK